MRDFGRGSIATWPSFGNDVVMMWNGTIPAVANQHTGMRPYQLTLGDAEAIRQLPEVRGLTVELPRSDLYEVSQWSNTSSHVMGVDPNYTQVRFIPMAQGRFLNDADVSERRRVAVLGSKAALLLFKGRPMVGETITINGTAVHRRGRGGQDRRGNNDFDDQKVYIPVTTMQELFPLKGDNIAQDALTSIQYQPAKKGDTTGGGRGRASRDCRAAWIRSIHEGCLSGVGHRQGDEDDRRHLYGDGYFSGRRGDCDAGAGRGGDHQHHAGFGDGADRRDRIAQGSGRDEAEHPGAVLLGGAAADGGERAIGIAVLRGLDGAAADSA